MSLGKICPGCGSKLKRKAAQYYWRGATMHGWVCTPCNSLWDLNNAFIRYVQKRTKKEGAPLVKVLYGTKDEYVIDARVSRATFEKIEEYNLTHPPPLTEEDVAYIKKLIEEDPDARKT